MADYKVVDAEQLNADLSSIADAIRDRAKTTESINFPNGFVSAVNNLIDTKGILDATISGEVVIPVNVTKLRRGAFYDCVKLEKVIYHDGVTFVDGACFFSCTKLKECILPVGVKTITSQTFFLNYALTKVDGWLTALNGTQAFYGCGKLSTFIIRSDSMCTLENTSTFTGTAIANGTGYIYVPSALIDSYKSATNWSTYANQFRALEDYTVDGTTTGAFDESKI